MADPPIHGMHPKKHAAEKQRMKHVAGAKRLALPHLPTRKREETDIDKASTAPKLGFELFEGAKTWTARSAKGKARKGHLSKFNGRLGQIDEIVVSRT